MERRQFLSAAPALLGSRLWSDTHSAALPGPIPEPYFPSRLYQFVWRNWELAPAASMAEVVRTSERNILDLGASLGLPRKRDPAPEQLRRIYITTIRQNWHLLPNTQIIRLLGWTREKFDFTLKEDDFLDVKLGRKPECPELFYQPPSAAERRGAAEIKRTVRQVFGTAIDERGEDLFQFVRDLSGPVGEGRAVSQTQPSPGEIDLSHGWTLVIPEDAVLAGAAQRFRRYLVEAMGAKLETSTAKTVRLEIDPSGFGSPESFRISCNAAQVLITGASERGALQALNWLEDQMEQREAPLLKQGAIERKCVWDPRYLYSYFSLYGDPLLETEIDPLPSGYLERLARTGINGVWMQAVLNNLAPSKHFPEFGAGSEKRLETLNGLVERARRFGLKIYLYLNEPRAMPSAFFEKHPGVKGAPRAALNAMCTSVPEVREWIADSLAHVTKQVPGLGGFFCITMSENFTNCFSHGSSWGGKAPVAKGCPRCSQRQSWEVIGELVRTFRDGVRRSSAEADIIVWDWGWPDELAANLIPLLPRDARFMSISEWSQPVHRGGVDTSVGEYSISVVGPGPRAKRNWQRARASGIRTMAKVQFNNTWEISAVPYIPVPYLVLEHCRNLASAGVGGIMPSWTCGGYPSPNLAAAKAYYFEPRPADDEIIAGIAAQRYGKAAAPGAAAAWKKFSEAFVEYPYGVAMYTIPTQHGPGNLLRLDPSGYRASMILFPQDDLKGWCGAYPPEAVLGQFAKMASLWKEGLVLLRGALATVPARKRANAHADLAIAETCYNHFQSTANQVEFYLLRAALEKGDRTVVARMRAIAEAEAGLANEQFRIARRHSLIAYEASNHYYYTPLDLVEKVLNCRQVLKDLAQGDGPR